MNGKKIKDFERNFVLRAAIEDLITRGVRDIDWYNQRLQIILDEAKPKLEAPGLAAERINELVHLWESAFPRRGLALMELLLRFYHPGHLTQAKRLWFGVENNVRNAISWCDNLGEVKLVRHQHLDYQSAMDISLGEVLKQEFGREFDAELTGIVHSKLADMLAQEFATLRERIQREYSELRAKQMVQAVYNTMFYACAERIAGVRSQTFVHLLDLFLNDIYVVGFKRRVENGKTYHDAVVYC